MPRSHAMQQISLEGFIGGGGDAEREKEWERRHWLFIRGYSSCDRENVQWECVSFWQLMKTHPAATRSLSVERWSA